MVYTSESVVSLVLSAGEAALVAFVVTATQIAVNGGDFPCRFVVCSKGDFKCFATEVAVEVSHEEDRALVLLTEFRGFCNDVSYLLGACIVASGHHLLALPPQMGVGDDEFLSALLHLEYGSCERLGSAVVVWECVWVICCFKQFHALFQIEDGGEVDLVRAWKECDLVSGFLEFRVELKMHFR